MPRKLLSVVIPVYNEEENVDRAYAAVAYVFDNTLGGKYDWEIVFTDNHSEDRTFAKIEEIASQDKRVRAVKFTRNFGFNKSLLTAYRMARGDAAIQLDCDLQDSPSIFLQFIKLWEEGHDVVVGLRQERPESKWLLGARKIFYRFLSNISEDNLVIDGGDFRLVDKHILDQLRKMNIATPYVRGLISTLSKKQTGFSYKRSKREFGKSKFPVTKLIGLAVDGIISHSVAPLRLATLAAALTGFAAVILAFIYFLGRLLWEDFWPDGLATTLLIQLFGIAMNAFFLGIIGEYLSRIYQQLRDMPITVVEKSVNFE
ncbi:MAG: glycosyltransferase family 2 protein [Alphaproteobacteria bacterium]|nr:glycosyltransferase family 2 protein [Alphaproteobacteria bacterium]